MSKWFSVVVAAGALACVGLLKAATTVPGNTAKPRAKSLPLPNHPPTHLPPPIRPRTERSGRLCGGLGRAMQTR